MADQEKLLDVPTELVAYEWTYTGTKGGLRPPAEAPDVDDKVTYRRLPGKVVSVAKVAKEETPGGYVIRVKVKLLD